MKRPVIGITCCMDYEDKKRKYPFTFAFDYLKRHYTEAVELAGGIPLILPNIENLELTGDIIKTIDGLLLSGGGDIHPTFFGQKMIRSLQRSKKYLTITKQRDRFEIELVIKAKKKKIPVFGICKGHQVLNVALGGTLHQDLSLLNRKTIEHSTKGNIKHKKKHKVEIKKGTLLFSIIKKKTIEVDTDHHQVIKDMAPGFITSAKSEDGIIEAIESPEDDFLLSVQWHPEMNLEEKTSLALFKSFIRACLKRK